MAKELLPLTEDQIWRKIKAEIEVQLYDFGEQSLAGDDLDERPDADGASSLITDNIKSLLKKHGYKIMKDE